MICSIDYVHLIQNKIITQDFTYPSLSPDYAKWKQEHFPNAKTFWHLGGDLVKAVQALQLGAKTWAGTIPQGIFDSGHKSYGRTTSTEILKYAHVLEEGYGNIKARPLFAPTNEEYEKNGYEVRLEEARKSIIINWGK